MENCNMKKMKHFIKHVFLAGLLAGSMVTLGFSQEELKNDTAVVEMAKTRLEEQKEILSLSEQQEQLMYDVNLKYIKEMQQLRSEGRSVSTLKKLMEMSNRMDKEVVVILDEDQYKGYLKMKDERRKEMMKRMKSQRGDG